MAASVRRSAPDGGPSGSASRLLPQTLERASSTPVRRFLVRIGPNAIPLAVRAAIADDGEMLPDRILFVDAEAIVIDKPAGLPVDAPRIGGDSVAARLDDLKLGFQRAPVPVHRLDRDTSGCLLLARNPKAVKRFARAFEQGEVEKAYLAVVDRELAESEGLIDLPLRKISSAEEGWRMVGHPEGRPAQTRWRLLAVRDGRSLVEFRPLTGRTHQIRAHAREGLGAPIAGDPFYGSAGRPPSQGSAQRMMLHALRLLVPRPPKQPVDATAPLPPHFAEWADAA